MKKIILLVLGMVFLTNCGNNGINNNVAVAPENRESFTENPYFKSDKFLVEGEKYRQSCLQNVKKNEYNTFLEAVKEIYDCNHCIEELKEKYNNKIKEFEENTNSKFYLYKGENFKSIYFTPIEKSPFKGDIVEISIPNYTSLDYYVTEKPMLSPL